MVLSVADALMLLAVLVLFVVALWRTYNRAFNRGYREGVRTGRYVAMHRLQAWLAKPGAHEWLRRNNYELPLAGIVDDKPLHDPAADPAPHVRRILAHLDRDEQGRPPGAG